MDDVDVDVDDVTDDVDVDVDVDDEDGSVVVDTVTEDELELDDDVINSMELRIMEVCGDVGSKYTNKENSPENSLFTERVNVSSVF